MITLNIAKFLKRLLDASENHLLNGLGLSRQPCALISIMLIEATSSVHMCSWQGLSLGPHSVVCDTVRDECFYMTSSSDFSTCLSTRCSYYPKFWIKADLYTTVIFFPYSLPIVDNKRDATNAGLPWPNTSTRQNLGGPIRPGTTSSSTSSAPAPSPTTTAPAASSSTPDTTDTATYTTDPSAHGATPFPHTENSWEHRRPPSFFTEQTVHQVSFKVFTFDHDRRELWINHQGLLSPPGT